MSSEHRLTSIDALRGIAAFAVCLFHISNGNNSYLPDTSFLKQIGSYGWLGVEVFFVISGFIIPYSLYKGNYKYSNTKVFLLKRISRIDPPYIVTILLVLFLNYLSTLSPYYQGNEFNLDYTILIAHLGYLNAFFDLPWISPVFWTLAIEFQFYILIALLFPLLNHKVKIYRYLTLTVFVFSAYYLPLSSLLFKYSSLFVIGVVAFYYHTNQFRQSEWMSATSLALFICYQTLGVEQAVVAFLTVICFKFSFNHRILIFLGTFSYSLYLIHVPIGGRLINFSINFINESYLRELTVLLAIGISLFFAYIFYLIVERPSINLSKSFSYKHQPSGNNTYISDKTLLSK